MEELRAILTAEWSVKVFGRFCPLVPGRGGVSSGIELSKILSRLIRTESFRIRMITRLRLNLNWGFLSISAFSRLRTIEVDVLFSL
jgi:hypothetical protein